MPVIDGKPTVSLNKIMYATDFSPVADQAGNYAKALAHRFGSTVEIVHALSSSEDDTPVAVDEIHQHIHRLTEKQKEFRASGISTVFSQSYEYPSAGALLLMERQLGPDLIVVGTSSKSTLDRFLLGSTAECLIRDAVCPVLTIGPHAKQLKDGPLPFEKIVFATDFSDASNKAAGLAFALAQDAGGHLWVVHVANTELKDANENEGEQEHELREQLSQMIPEEAYDWCFPERTIEHGNPAHSILHLANRVDADLIVMGARRKSFRLMHLRRGVTQSVLAQAPCPVLTVH